MLDVVALAIAEFGRQRVRAEKRRAHADAELAADPPGHAQHLQFAVEIEAVARLDLDRGHAIGEQRCGPRQRRGEQGIVVERARRVDGRGDAAAGAGDLFVAGAVQAHVEFVGAVAAEDEMGMAVDQARRDPGTGHRFDLAAECFGCSRAGHPCGPANTMRPSFQPSAASVDRAEGGTVSRIVASRQSVSRPSQRVAVVCSFMRRLLQRRATGRARQHGKRCRRAPAAIVEAAQHR